MDYLPYSYWRFLYPKQSQGGGGGGPEAPSVYPDSDRNL